MADLAKECVKRGFIKPFKDDQTHIGAIDFESTTWWFYPVSTVGKRGKSLPIEKFGQINLQRNKEGWPSPARRKVLKKQKQDISHWEQRFKEKGLSPTLRQAEEQLTKSSFQKLSRLHRQFILLRETHVSFQNGAAHENDVFGMFMAIDFFSRKLEGKQRDRRYISESLNGLKLIGAKDHHAKLSKIITLYGDGTIGDEDAVFEYYQSLSSSKKNEISRLAYEYSQLPSWYLTALKWDWQEQGQK